MDFLEIKEHPFFKGVDFEQVANKSLEIPEKWLLEQYYDATLKKFHQRI